MKIADYLIELLYQRETVILPGFGEFSAKPAAASVSKKNKLTPPSKILDFNPSVKANDYVLAKFISEKEAVTITRGNEMIREFVDHLNQTLDSRHEVSIPGIGNFFYQDEDHQILMIDPDKTHSFDPASFGLTPVSVEVHPQDETVELPDNELKGEKTEAIPDTPAETPGASDIPEKKPKKRKYIWLIILVLLLTAAVTLGIIYREGVTEYVRYAIGEISSVITPSEETGKKISPRESTSGKKIPAITDEEIPAPAENTIEETTPDSLQQTTETQNYAPSPEDNYVIIAGCFEEEANARRMADKLVSEGFSQATIDGKTSSGLFMVAAGFFNSNEEAAKVLRQAKSENKLRNAWITKR